MANVGQVSLKGDLGEGSYYVQFLPDEANTGLTTREVHVGQNCLINIDLTSGGSLFGIEVVY